MSSNRLRDPRIFALLCVLIGGMGQGVVAPQLPELLSSSKELMLSSGLSAALMYLGIFVSTFRYGSMADAGRVSFLLSAGLIGYSLTLVGLGWVRSSFFIFILRFVEGLALSAVYVAADFLLGRLSSNKERGQWLSYYGVALSIGLLLGPLVALFGVTKSLFSVAAIAMVFGFLSTNLRVPRIHPESASKITLPLGPLITGAAYGFMEAGLVALFPVLAVQEFKVSPEYCLMSVILSAAASSVFWGIASDRVGPSRIIHTLFLGLTIGPLSLAGGIGFMPASLIAYSACVIFGTLAGGLYPVGFSWLLQSLPESHYGYASGSFARAYGLGSLLGPLCVGVASHYYGSLGLFSSMSAVGLVGAIHLFSLKKNKSIPEVGVASSPPV